ncbi:MAG: lamin tail domain-containing protein, partial [Anaerolineae bacterium]|nr:lamin tail domain-containing protein [Anaerolineae bacterium]
VYGGQRILNTGEELVLLDNVGHIIDTANRDLGYGNGWAAGKSSPDYTMERIDPTGSDRVDNWATNDGVIRNGLDANGDPINGTPGAQNASISVPKVCIYALHPYALRTSDEAVALINLGAVPVWLTGWGVSDGPSTPGVTLPDVAIAPGRVLWVADDAGAFSVSFGFSPDVALSDAGHAIPLLSGSWPGFSNSGDEAILYDNEGRAADTLVYGDGVTETAEWNGKAVSYPLAGFGKGQILFRKRDELTGLPVTDTDSAVDWANDVTPGPVLYGLVHEGDLYGKRVMYPGWDWDLYDEPFAITATVDLTVAIAPDNAYTPVAHLLRRAQAHIVVQAYTFESVWLTGILTERITAGVQVTMLLEGAPAGGMSDQQLWNCEKIVDAGGHVYFMHNDSTVHIFDRYTSQHAKFVVVDGRWVAVGSENFGNHALPVDDKANGTAGNRGIVLIVDQADTARYLETLFSRDCDPIHHHDIVSYGALDKYTVPVTYTAVYSTGGGGYNYMAPFSATMPALQAERLEVIHSPETGLRYNDGLIGLVLRAGMGDEVYVEQMYERVDWGVSADGWSVDPNPRLEAYIQAARNGATVRILLDKGFDDQRKNYETAFYILKVAHREGLDLDVRLGNPTRRGIHNKMVLVNQGGNRVVHVGSINGSEVSSKGNREVALQVHSEGAYDTLKLVFDYDWAHSGGPYEAYFPFIFQDYVTESDHVLISEVMFNPPGADDMAEWVELYNPTGSVVDVGGWYLGDAVRRTDYERLYVFPTGTTIPAYGVLVVARQATAYQTLGYVNKPVPDFEWNDSSGSVPNMHRSARGEGEFVLGNAGDEILLLDGSRQAVDVVVYGSGGYAGVDSFGDVSGVYSGNSLERRPANRDANDCQHDFRILYEPAPGSVVVW